MVRVSYSKIKSDVEEKECRLVTSQNEFETNNLNQKSRIEIISRCGHATITTYNNIKHLNTGVLCKTCTKASITQKLVEYNLSCKDCKNHEVEHSSMEIIEDILSDTFDFIVLNEGTFGDFAVRPKQIDADLWLPIQLKTTYRSPESVFVYSFKVKPNYYDMPVLLFAVCEMKFWLIDGNDIKIENICIGKKNSVYDTYAVKSNELSKTFSHHYNSTKFNKTIEELNKPISQQAQLSQEYARYREKYLPYLDFKYPKHGYKVYDFYVQNNKVQEKVATKGAKPNVYVVHVRRNKTQYSIGDNDFYWIHIPNTTYFYVFPQDVLITNNIIGENALNCWLYLYPAYKKKPNTQIKQIWQFNYLYDYEHIDEGKIKDIFNLQ